MFDIRKSDGAKFVARISEDSVDCYLRISGNKNTPFISQPAGIFKKNHITKEEARSIAEVFARNFGYDPQEIIFE